MEKNNFRIYKGVRIEYYYNGTKREYQTQYANIGRYGTLKEIQNRITLALSHNHNESYAKTDCKACIGHYRTI